MWSLSGAAAHLLAINPPCGNLAPVSARCGRSTKNTESATIALAVIMRIACNRIPPGPKFVACQLTGCHNETDPLPVFITALPTLF